MNIRHLPLYLGLSLALGIAGTFSGTQSAQAQSANLSDVTGNIITTSDIVGGFGSGGGNQVIFAFRTAEIRRAVNSEANTVNQLLAANNLPVVDIGGTPTPIPASVQQNLLILLTARGNVDANVTQLANGLTNAGASSTLARNLALSLRGLTSGGTVPPGQFRAVIEAYNALISASSYNFLNEPPEELRAIQAVLSILLNAAYASR